MQTALETGLRKEVSEGCKTFTFILTAHFGFLLQCVYFAL